MTSAAKKDDLEDLPHEGSFGCKFRTANAHYADFMGAIEFDNVRQGSFGMDPSIKVCFR